MSTRMGRATKGIGMDFELQLLQDQNRQERHLRSGAKTCRCGERIVLQTYSNGKSEWRHTAQRTAYADPYYCVSGHIAKPEGLELAS